MCPRDRKVEKLSSAHTIEDASHDAHGAAS